MKFTVLFFAFLFVTLSPACSAVSVRFLPKTLPPGKAGSVETIAAIVRSTQAQTVRLDLQAPANITAEPSSRTITLKPGTDLPVFYKLTFTSDCPADSQLTAIIDSKKTASLPIGRCYDLEGVAWKARFDKDNVGTSQGWMKPDFDDSAWSESRLPSQWNDVGITYLRTKLYIPESWRGKDVTLRIKAIDDNDICYLNGTEIGRTDGWDNERSYKVKPEAIRYGSENLLVIAVNNTNAGGGIYKSPSYFGIDIPKETPKPTSKLATAGKIGKPMPFRRMTVKNGVLLYEDGGEVALWGVNCYPQSWYQFDNMKRLGVDMKMAIRNDLDDMKKMGVEVIRIHVFDREISDAKGSLIDNEHLDLLDYLISEASKRGIYFMFTPIAWWWGPNQNPDSFSAHTPKEYMFCDDQAIKSEASYIANWLDHVNRYTGRKYKDEPAICVFEIMNEPGYVTYNMMTDPEACYYPTDPKELAPFKARLKIKWQNWCRSNGITEDARFFPLFRYHLMSDYLDTMHTAIRRTGAKQPVACALYDTYGQDDLISAVADSPCEAVTTGLYAGAWDKTGDGVNYLPYTANTSLDSRLDKKARLVYEFDAIKTFGSYFYPAASRYFRHLGAQICCMFQYDSSATAEWNTDWDAHYLNLRYTPGKAVSFYIGGQVFHDLSRGSTYPTEGTTQSFKNCAVSFDKNASLYCTKTIYANSAPVPDWKPIKVPEKPTFIMGVGDSPYASCKGTGIYTLDIDYPKRTATLTVYPDAEVVGDPWHPDPKKSAVVLKDASHTFTLNLPGMTISEVKESDGKKIEVKNNGFEARAGVYEIKFANEAVIGDR